MSLARTSFALGWLLTCSACGFRDYDYGRDAAANGGAGGIPSTSSAGVAGADQAWPNSATAGGAGVPSTSAAGVAGASPACLVNSGAVCEPACAAVPNVDHVKVPTPAVHWTFDSDDAPLSDDTGSYALTLHSQDPSAASPLSDEIRMNGHGNAIHLDGNQYYAADGNTRVPSIQTGGTVAALISIAHDTLPTPEPGSITIWPIVSTLATNESGHCGGYQLDIRRDATRGLAIAFSHAFRSSDASSGCQTETHSLALDRPSWAWNTGHWHHVAATYTPRGGQAIVTLHWDSDSPNARRSSDALFDHPMSESASTLYIGTNSDESDASVRSKFKGIIDEVAIFATPLEAVQLAQFTATSTTYAGPSGCRWQATEAHQDVVLEHASRSQWRVPDTTGLQVQFDDGDWGAPAVGARLAAAGTGRDLTPYREIILTADGMEVADTPNGAFEFSLSAGDDSCTWYVPAQGNRANTYRIDLAHPDYCQSSSCQFAINNVEWASIRASWEYPTFNDASETNGVYSYSIYRLDLVKGDSALDPLRYGGVLGPNDWCWRTQAFQAKTKAKARFTFEPEPQAALRADLSGLRLTSSAIVADYGEDTIDLSSCSKIAIDATLSPDERTSGSFPSVTLQNRYGAWSQWAWSGATETVTINLGTSTASSDNPIGQAQEHVYNYWVPYYNKFPPFDIHEVSMLAIQKNWLWETPASLEIRGVEFLDNENRPHCEVVNRRQR